MLCHRTFHSNAIRNKFFCSILITFVVGLLATPTFAQHLHELYYNNIQWIDTDLTATTGGPLVQPQGIAAFYTTPNDQFHVYYASNVGEDYHIHQLYFNGSAWSDADLTALTGGAVASNSSGMTGFSIGNAQYLYFCANDFSLHEYSSPPSPNPSSAENAALPPLDWSLLPLPTISATSTLKLPPMATPERFTMCFSTARNGRIRI